ncbi:hypothetical protein HSRCO_0519 [Halanaeroarchaeum sp. HSR-CO]|uniref:hypothetical protein n=1 Tax=Halanaeroarchaeum sp. HSR-CO TaxID=2866382 RepID=UPI00217EBA29|nr:hypothetical protein [Halanaeroarchaeum sp. HSR-CO]UWG46815.1 hypothetical protein HSRCO_0519 [Halanaeroarchaeum sp. HSR-CO]
MSNEHEQTAADRPSTESADRGARDEGAGMSRRRMMAAGAAGWATVGLAGCASVSPDCDAANDGDGAGSNDGSDSDGGDGDDGDGDGGDGDGGANVTVTSQTTTTEGDTPTEDGDGGDGGDGATTTECEQASVFAPGMDVGFLVSVYDNLTGDLLDDERLSKVQISFPETDLDPIELTPSGPHERHVRDKWGGKASFAADAEPGTYRYEIEVERASDNEPRAVVVDELKLVEPRY